jgi:hypothetical protein
VTDRRGVSASLAAVGDVTRRRRSRALRLRFVVLATIVPLLFATRAVAQVAPVPAPASTTIAADAPFALGPGGALYVGGWWRFETRTGSSVAFDGSGAVDAAWPEVDGPVAALAADGTGGWFIAGNFAHVGGRPRGGLAHIRAGGTVDPAWAPATPDDAVNALTVNAGTVYVGGDFSAIGRQPRGRLAALDGASGRLLPWRPKVDD